MRQIRIIRLITWKVSINLNTTDTKTLVNSTIDNFNIRTLGIWRELIKTFEWVPFSISDTIRVELCTLGCTNVNHCIWKLLRCLTRPCKNMNCNYEPILLLVGVLDECCFPPWSFFWVSLLTSKWNIIFNCLMKNSFDWVVWWIFHMTCRTLSRLFEEYLFMRRHATYMTIVTNYPYQSIIFIVSSNNYSFHIICSPNPLLIQLFLPKLSLVVNHITKS